MDTVLNAVFYPWEAALLLGPVIGFFLRRVLRPSDRRMKLGLYAALGALLLLAVAVLFSPLSFRGIGADALVGASGYIAFCIFAFATLSFRRIGKPAFLAMAVPMAAGILLATIGVIGLWLTLGDTIPLRETWANSRYSCRFNSSGNATTSYGGVDVTVLYHPAIAPGLVWKRYSRSFDSKYEFDNLACTLDVNAGTLVITARRVNGSAETIKLITVK